MTKTVIFLPVVLLMATLSANAQRTYLDQTTIDRSVKPGDDFFNYANGGWIKANDIPATEASWGNWGIKRDFAYRNSLPHYRNRTTSLAATPVDACQFFYDCAGCGSLIRPLPGDCCVFCSYGSIKCPPTQEQKSCCR